MVTTATNIVAISKYCHKVHSDSKVQIDVFLNNVINEKRIIFFPLKHFKNSYF